MTHDTLALRLAIGCARHPCSRVVHCSPLDCLRLAVPFQGRAGTGCATLASSAQAQYAAPTNRLTNGGALPSSEDNPRSRYLRAIADGDSSRKTINWKFVARGLAAVLPLESIPKGEQQTLP